MAVTNPSGYRLYWGDMHAMFKGVFAPKAGRPASLKAAWPALPWGKNTRENRLNLTGLHRSPPRAVG